MIIDVNKTAFGKGKYAVIDNCTYALNFETNYIYNINGNVKITPNEHSEGTLVALIYRDGKNLVILEGSSMLATIYVLDEIEYVHQQNVTIKSLPQLTPQSVGVEIPLSLGGSGGSSGGSGSSTIDYSNLYKKSEIDLKVTNLENKIAAKIDESVAKNTFETKTVVSEKADKKTTYTKTEVDEKITDLDITSYATKAELSDYYSRSTTDSKLLQKVDRTELESNYTNNTDLKSQLSNKVNTTELNSAIDARKKEQAELQAAVLETSQQLSSQITSISTEVENTSKQFTQKMAEVVQSVNSTSENMTNQLTSLTTNINAVKNELVAKDSSIEARVAEIESFIPNDTSEDNELANKNYVIDMVQNNAARELLLMQQEIALQV